MSTVTAPAAGATAERDLGHRISGPSAVGEDRGRFWRLAWVIAVTDFKLKFFGSALGYLWQLMKPLMLFGVLYVVFTVAIDLGEGVQYFATALLLGIVLFSYLREATSGAVRILVEREALVRKVQFPRLALPVAVVTTSIMNLGLNLVPIFVFLAIEGARPRLSWVELPFVTLGLVVLSLGLALLLSASFVRYRDVDPIWDVVLQALFYASPVFYPVQTIANETVVRILLINPFAALLQEWRHALLGPSHPSTAQAMGGAEWLLLPGGITLLLAVWGWRVFRRAAPDIAERL